jgi:hypothetical protein
VTQETRWRQPVRTDTFQSTTLNPKGNAVPGAMNVMDIRLADQTNAVAT